MEEEVKFTRSDKIALNFSFVICGAIALMIGVSLLVAAHNHVAQSAQEDRPVNSCTAREPDND